MKVSLGLGATIVCFGLLSPLVSQGAIAASPSPTRSMSVPASLSDSSTRRIAQAPTVASLEAEVLRQVNQYRASKKLPPLKMDATISQQARLHSQNMASGTVPFSHNGFDQRVKAIGKTIAWSGVAENVAYNMGYADPVTQAVKGWIKSDGHRRNMEGNYNLTGIGIAQNAKGEFYFTQIFVKSR